MSLDIEGNDAFRIRELSGYFNERVPVPSHLGDLGIFTEKGIRSRLFTIEQKSNVLALVPSKPVNAPGTPTNAAKGKSIAFETAHLPLQASVFSSEVEGVRELGTENEYKTLESEVNEHQDDHGDALDATHEHFRIGAIKGQILDSDGTTVIDDLYTKFGMSQSTFATDLGTPATNGPLKILEMLNLLDNKMLGKYFMGARVICGENFFKTFVTREDVRDAFARFSEGEFLRADSRNGFKFGGDVTWEQYRGQVGEYKFVDTDDAYVIPMNTRQMFMTYFSPANHRDVVNTKGVPYYTSIEALKHGKGWEVETQSNIFCLNRNPQGVIKLSL